MANVTDKMITIMAICENIWPNETDREKVLKKLESLKIQTSIELYLYLPHINGVLKTKVYSGFKSDTKKKMNELIIETLTPDVIKLINFISDSWEDVGDQIKVYHKLNKINILCFDELKNNIDELNNQLIVEELSQFTPITLEKINQY